MTSACRACGTQLPPLAARCPSCGVDTAVPGFSSAPTLPPGAPTLPPAGQTLPPAGQTLPPAGQTLGGPGTAPGASREDTGPLQPGQSFGPRYHVRRLLGLGGMGAVYHAWDTELGIDVAIKLIRPDIIADSQAAAEIQRRFKRELLLARLVSHKNVVRIHDIGEIDRIKYITMSYVDGTDLASTLAAEGRLQTRRVVQLARRICSGLVAAHAAGVVHRDLKPANIMVGADDEPVITDFGIARLTNDKVADTDGGLIDRLSGPGGALGARYAGFTRLGSMVGTIEYMPPEQARGELVDQRADIYSFGLMLYDMLAGPVRRKQAGSALDELQSRSKAVPVTLQSLVADVPEGLDELIARCLEPDPAKRFQTSAEVAQALDRLDDDGRRIAVQRTVGLPRVLVVAAVALVGIGAAWWFFRPEPPAPPKDPVSVVIADFANTTGDAELDDTLEPVLKVALESAAFITAYSRSDIRRGLGVQPPEELNEQAARELAVKQGLGVVLASRIMRDGNRFQLETIATQAVTGAELARAEARASSREDVLVAVGELAEEVRQSLGDETDDDTQRFAMETLTATSLDVVRDYAKAMDALASSQFEAARKSFARAVEKDPQFGLAHAGMAIASANLGNQQEATRHVTEAVRHVDRMTERERFRTRGLYYYLTADYPSCVKEYGALIEKFSADAAARNNLALCSTRLRDMPKALAEMREAVEILPNRALYRVNLALYAAYASDFESALAEATRAREMSPLGYVPTGFALQGLGRLDELEKTYAEFAKVNALGESHAASGRGDLAIYQGRYAAAVRILEQGAAADLAQDNPDRAAAKLAAAAYAELSRGRKPQAIALAKRALETSGSVRQRFLAGRIYAQAGAAYDARMLEAGLAKELQAEPRAYAGIIAGELALAEGDPRRAIDVLTAANSLLDTWIGRFTLGRAYLEAGAFAQADSEFDRCMTRRGEALALFLDEEPTYGFYPAVDYYLGKVREGLNSSNYADAYRRYIAVRGAAGEDPWLADARKHAAEAPAN